MVDFDKLLKREQAIRRVREAMTSSSPVGLTCRVAIQDLLVFVNDYDRIKQQNLELLAERGLVKK